MIKKILKRRQGRVVSGAIVIMAAYALSSLLGLIRSRTLAGAFFGGREMELDVFYAASVIPDSILQPFLIGALGAVMIPSLAKLFGTDDKKAWNYIKTFTKNLAWGFLVISGLIFIFTEWLVTLIAPGMTAWQIELLIPTTRILVVTQIIFLLSAVSTSVLQSWQRFLLPAMAPVVYNLGIIGGTLMAGRWGVYGPVAGTVVGAMMHLGVQLPVIFKESKGKINNLLGLHNGEKLKVTKDLVLMLPRSLALGVAKIEKPWVLFLVSGMTAGSFAIYNLARQLWILPISLFGMAVAQAAFPAMAAEKDRGKLAGILFSSLGYIAYLCLPAGVLILVLRIPLVRLAFGVKELPWEMTILAGKILAVLALSIFTQASTQLLSRVFYAAKDNWIPLVVSVVDMVLLIGVSWWLVARWGVVGVAGGVTVASIFSFLLLLYLVNRKYTQGLKGFEWGEWIKMLAGAVVMGVMLWGPMRLADQWIDTTRVLGLVALTVGVGIVGTGVYACWCKLFKVKYQEEMLEAVGKAKRLLVTKSLSVEGGQLES